MSKIIHTQRQTLADGIVAIIVNQYQNYLSAWDKLNKHAFDSTIQLSGNDFAKHGLNTTESITEKRYIVAVPSSNALVVTVNVGIKVTVYSDGQFAIGVKTEVPRHSIKRTHNFMFSFPYADSGPTLIGDIQFLFDWLPKVVTALTDSVTVAVAVVEAAKETGK